jgi:hypothetical protein
MRWLPEVRTASRTLRSRGERFLAWPKNLTKPVSCVEEAVNTRCLFLMNPPVAPCHGEISNYAPMPAPFPLWKYYPPSVRPPAWVQPVIDVFGEARHAIDSASISTTSDKALALLRTGLEELDFEVEAGKKRVQKIRRPVLFGEYGHEDMAYEVDAFHPDKGIALEVEAGRGARGNAVYRDLIQTSLLVDAEYLVLAVQTGYRHKSGGKDIVVHSYRDTMNLLNAIYASNRLRLPLAGILLIGY